MKWNKQVFDLEIDLSLTVEVLKMQVMSLTSVPADRQKLMLPGGPLKEDEDLSKRKIKPGLTVMLIGTAEADEIKAPTEKTKFVEDLSPAELAIILKEKNAMVPPAGLQNLGNTCYANSVVQALACIPQWRDSMEEYLSKSSGQHRNIEGQFTAQLAGLVKELNKTTGKITPSSFVMCLKQRFPNFAETTPEGMPKQQDAEEFLTGLFQTVHSVTVDEETKSSPVDRLFGFKMKTKLKCLEAEDEPETTMSEDKRLLLCHLGTPTEPVSMLHRGVEMSLKEHVEKTSPSLERMAQYEKVSAMETLPPLLIVQFARFQWKAKSDSAGTEASRTKVTRKCAFQRTMDVFDYASDELKKELIAGRRRKKKLDDIEFEESQNHKMDVDASATPAAAPMEVEKKEEKEGGMEVDASADIDPYDAKEYLSSGAYKLMAIVSHQGRTAEGGHYIAWSRIKEADGKEEKEDIWARYDDDQVDFCPVNHGAFKDLIGGKADSQIAYFVFYEKIDVKKLTPEQEKKHKEILAKQEAEDAERFKNEKKKPAA